MTDVLSQPVRVNERGECLYFCDGDVCVDVQSGTKEQRAAVLAFLAQTQEMARLLKRIDSSAGFDATSTAFQAEVKKVLRDAGVK